MERKKTEEFKKAFEDFRNGNLNEDKKLIIKSETGINVKEEDMIKLILIKVKFYVIGIAFNILKKKKLFLKIV